MVEMHGWVTIRDTYKDTFIDNMDQVVKELVQEFKTIKYLNPEIKWMDGTAYLELSLFTNHWSEDCKEMLKLYEIIADKAEGSYGVLYVNDDEDNDLFNEFVVYRIVRGKVEKFSDKLLSPCIPVIEDGEIINV